jgi:hypothetical protein
MGMMGLAWCLLGGKMLCGRRRWPPKRGANTVERERERACWLVVCAFLPGGLLLLLYLQGPLQLRPSNIVFTTPSPLHPLSGRMR